jgi:hypothetical protein
MSSVKNKKLVYKDSIVGKTDACKIFLYDMFKQRHPNANKNNIKYKTYYCQQRGHITAIEYYD